MTDDPFPTALTWRGKRVDEMDKERLIDIIHYLIRDIEDMRKIAHRRNMEIADRMRAAK